MSGPGPVSVLHLRDAAGSARREGDLLALLHKRCVVLPLERIRRHKGRARRARVAYEHRPLAAADLQHDLEAEASGSFVGDSRLFDIPTIPGFDKGRGPSWIASVINAIGESPYWDSTVVIIVWDDWGGEYDNVAPPQLDGQGLGMRVPMLLVSAYARKTVSQPGYVSHTQYEFGSILNARQRELESGIARCDRRARQQPDRLLRFYSRTQAIYEDPCRVFSEILRATAALRLACRHVLITMTPCKEQAR